MCNCLRNTFGSEIRSVAVEMSDMLEQCKEVVEEMTRKVVEFVENNMGMVEDNLGQVGNNLEEAWGNTTSIFDIVSKVAVGAILLLISLPYWIYHCLAGNTIQCKSFLWLKCFSPQGTISVCSEMPSILATFHMICAQPVANK